MAGTLFARFALFAVLATLLAILAVASLSSSALGASPSTMLLGNRQVGSHESHLKPGQAEAFRFRTRASGVAGVVDVYIDQGSTARALTVGIYSDAGGHPGSLLSEGSRLAPPVHTWNTVSMTPSSLTSGKTYWLAVLSDDGTLRYRSPQRRSCLSNTSLRAHLHRLPELWRRGPARARTRCPISAYLLAASSSLSLSPLVSGSPPPPLAPSPPPILPPQGETPAAGAPASTLPPANTQPSEETPPPPFEETPPPPSEETPPPPPPAAPANTVPPAISGSPVEDETLKASTGTWTGSPTSYAYMWKICKPKGVECSNLSGATSSSYKLISSDVRHDLRVAVTASNASGHSEANSPATAEVTAETPPPPPPQAPTNTVPPTISGSPVEDETLKASTGTWTGSPTSYTYQWQDCYALGMGCLSISGANASSYKLTASDVESTIRVVVTASNAAGHDEATSAATGTVEPPAPKNTAAPAISGSAAEGETLQASTGTWSGNPTSYTYQWESCKASGAKSCTAIGGATTGTRALTSSDVGHTLRVVVKATNAGGSGEATSEATSVVTAQSGTPTGCFEDPESEGTSRFEACGYPGPKNTGVAETSGKTECSSLPEWNASTEPLAEGATIEGKELKLNIAERNGGGISTNASKLTLNKDCFLIKGECGCLQEGPALKLEAGATLTVENSTFRSPSPTESVEKDIWFNSSGSDIVAKNDRFEDCGECLNGLGKVEITDSYMDASQWEGKEPESSELHRENIYMMQGTAIVKGSTMFVPDDETAEIFDEDNGIACDTHVTFEDDFLSGSGQMFQLCGHSNGQVGTGSTIINHNRFARCLTTPIVQPVDGIPICSGPYVEGADSHGFMPSGGSSQILGNGETNPYGAQKEFMGNYWDDNLTAISIEEAEE